MVDIQRATVEHYLQHTPLAQQARLIPRLHNGRPNGVQVFFDDTQPPGLLAVMGIAHGDILLSVNDKPILESGMGWLPWPAAQPSFVDLEVDRHGTPVRIVVLIHE